ncbi:MAG TPA: Tn3 family transposase [Solirubrobacteraceae bacterium]|nr:Tn3 family transposase [Solirubrobacteraceae bacterium]
MELATRWGGEVASIDGLRFVVPNRTIHAGFNRRYYHRRRGVTALTTTADHHSTLHTVVVPGTQPDALYLLDGLLDPQTSVRPRAVMTDGRLHRRRLRPLPTPGLPVLPAAGRCRRRPPLAA